MFENAKIGILVVTKQANKDSFKDVKESLMSFNIGKPVNKEDIKLYPVWEFTGAEA